MEKPIHYQPFDLNNHLYSFGTRELNIFSEQKYISEPKNSNSYIEKLYLVRINLIFIAMTEDQSTMLLMSDKQRPLCMRAHESQCDEKSDGAAFHQNDSRWNQVTQWKLIENNSKLGQNYETHFFPEHSPEKNYLLTQLSRLN